MAKHFHVTFRADDRSYFAILKKGIRAIAISAGFSETKLGEIDIIVAEMVTNLVKHAGGGQVLVRVLDQDNRNSGIELLSVDNGVGMTDVSRMVADGVSTKNTLGNGLGAMKRLADLFQVYSLKEWGTVILVRVFEKPHPLFVREPVASIRSVLLPKHGEEACGDGFYEIITPESVRIFLGDGLGHGPEAQKAVTAAGDTFLSSTAEEPQDIIREIGIAVKKTRGLVGTVGVFSLKEKRWRICGVGNIMTKVAGVSASKIHSPYNGIIGLNVPRTLTAQEYLYEDGQHVIMCSDGLKSRWDTVKYPAIMRYDLTILAASLIKDFARNTDDMSAAVCKINL